MSREISETDLSKAAGNLKRLEQFFAARIAWRVDEEGGEALRQIQSDAKALMTTVGGLLQNHGIKFGSRPTPGRTPQENAADLDLSRLQKFSRFYSQLNQWFGSQTGATVPRIAFETLRGIHTSLGATEQTVRLILEGNQLAPVQPTEPEPEQIPKAAAEPLRKLREIKDLKKAKLELVNTTERPLLTSFKGGSELSGEAKDLIDAFLADNEIEIPEPRLQKYLVKVMNWIEAIPEGQALILKISTTQDEPIACYAPRSYEEPEP